MNLEIFEFIKNYITNNGEGANFESIFRFSIDCLLTLAIILFIFYFVFSHFKGKLARFGLVGITLLFVLSYLFKLHFLFIASSILFICYILMILFISAPEYKNYFTIFSKFRKEKIYIQSEESKNELIETLVKTVNYLSARKIGAIITLEKENSLNNYIDKATKIESIVSFELLATIFFPNTALHDGACIIRGNQLMCAGAFYPSSETADLPRQLGSRHRAGLGISEVSDSFTIVVSEETGNVSTMYLGTLNNNISIEKLRDSLSQNILVK